MSPLPHELKIYHITHVDNLAAIVATGALVCDRRIVESGGPVQTIGMSEIKRRRIEELEVSCHPGTKVGDYVPFYFCPRSVMLYVIHRANNPDLTYRGGQRPILHLEASVHRVVRWADGNGIRWAFSLSNAGARYAEFRSRLEELDRLNWAAIRDTDFRDPEVKEAKQAEFLVYDCVPFELIERIGVQSADIRDRALAALVTSSHRPPVETIKEWYY